MYTYREQAVNMRILGDGRGQWQF